MVRQTARIHGRATYADHSLPDNLKATARLVQTVSVCEGARRLRRGMQGAVDDFLLLTTFSYIILFN